MEEDKKASRIRNLLEKAQSGDSAAFGEIYREYYTPVFRYLYLRTRNRELSEDLVQTTFLKVTASLNRFRFREVSPLAYFFTVARHSLVDHWRKKKEVLFETEETGNDIPDAAPTPETATENRLTRELLEKIINDLSPPHRQIIEMRFFQELTNAEIAERLKKKEPAIRQIQCRALRELRALCQARHLFPNP